MTRVGDWMRLSVGDLVTAEGGRHIGRVESIAHSARVRVCWYETGWHEWFDLDQIERIEPRRALWKMFHPD